jgi:hypothetical protein
MRNIMNVLTQFKNSKEKMNTMSRINTVDSKPIMNSKGNSVKNLDLELENQLYEELTCINNTIADIRKIK